MNTPTTLAGSLLLAALCLPAHAQRLAAGLWEHTMSMSSASGETESALGRMQQQMAQMPPDQRKMMEDMMARQGAGVGPKGTTARTCVTPEQAARDEMPGRDAHCKQVSTERKGNVMRFRFSCAGDPPSSGEGEFTFVSDKVYKGRMTMETTRKGKPERMQTEHTGRWVAADCGATAPRKP